MRAGRTVYTARNEVAPEMDSQAITRKLQTRFGEHIIAAFPEGKHPRIHVDAANWRPIAEYLHGDPDLRLDWLACLSGVDYAADGKMCVVYDLLSFAHRHRFAVKVFCPRDNPPVPTVSDLGRAANRHEREAYAMFGIIFDGHPDPRRILCAEDWVGHPLRKDYVFPREYHGIPGSVELDWQQKPNYPT